jgi:hypothetical protein
MSDGLEEHTSPANRQQQRMGEADRPVLALDDVRGDRGVERGRIDADALEQIHEPLI